MIALVTNHVGTRKMLVRAGVTGDVELVDGFELAKVERVIAGYTAARAAFDDFAGLDVPDLPPDRYHAIQVELFRWQAANFPPSDTDDMALGLAEELGERCLAMYDLDSPGIDDAIGDMMVYACQAATMLRLGFREVVRFAHSDHGSWTRFRMRNQSEGLLLMPIAVGLFAHAALKAKQKIRGLGDDAEVTRFAGFLALALVANVIGMYRPVDNVLETFEKVACKVMKRDWIADREGRTAT